jgi:hypothetical protein
VGNGRDHPAGYHSSIVARRSLLFKQNLLYK